jgi:hypothetical protein
LDKLPFGVYDFFAYLSAGGVLLLTIDYVWALGMLSMKDMTPVLGIALIVLAYVTGHAVAHLSSWIFEQTVISRILGRPTDRLLGASPRLRIWGWLFPGYHRPLPANVQQRVKDQAQSRNCFVQDEGLFLHAFPLVTQNEKYQARLDTFLNLYGFARNMAFSLLAAAISIAIAHWYGPHPVRLRWSVLASIGAASMFYRYLKFFRQYSYELFVRYAELPRAESDAASVGV